MRHYVINLDRSVERWNSISASARGLGIELTRIPAINGVAITQANWLGFDIKGFCRENGRPPLGGEYGCYASHIAALKQFLADGGDDALILEDDTVLNQNLIPCLEKLRELCGNKAVLVRLTVNRFFVFEAFADLPFGLNLGQCWFGPNGNSGAYWITRRGAERLLKAATPARLTYDKFLERPWLHNVPSLMVKPNVLHPSPVHFSEIGHNANLPRPKKFVWYRRGGALLSRTHQMVRRLIHSARQRRLPG